MRHYLLAGRTGVGKSSFVNSVLGAPVAAVHDYQACTQVAEAYSYRGATGDVCLIDTPGLAEGDGGRDAAYLDRIAGRLDGIQVDGLLYVTPLHDARFRPEEEDVLAGLTRHLGPRIWWSSWLVFTFAGMVGEEVRRQRIPHRVAEFTAALARLTARPNELRRFRGFRQVLLVDNDRPTWATDARPLESFFR